MTSWFTEGYETVEKESARLDEQMNSTFLPQFRMKADEESNIIFHTLTPVNFYQHYVKSLNRYFTCSQKDCPICDIGNKASYTGAYLITDTRYEEWEDKKKVKQTRKNGLKVMTHGIKALKVIAKQASKRGLDKFGWELARNGEGTDTTYSFIPVDLAELIEKEGVKMPTADELKKAKEDMLKQLAPLERGKIMDILAGRTSTSNTSNSGSGGAASGGSEGGNFKVDQSQDADEGVLRFV